MKKKKRLTENPIADTDSNWSKNSNKKSIKGKDIQKMLGIEDVGHEGITKPPPMKLIDLVQDFYEDDEEESDESEVDNEES